MVRGKNYRSPLVDKIQKPDREAATTYRVVPFQKYFLEHCKYVHLPVHTVKSRVLTRVNKSGFWVCLYTRRASKRDGILLKK